jgi:cell division protein FtsI/penicillin-binding protein 2/cell division protein FtsW (lipid II flippase)
LGDRREKKRWRRRDPWGGSFDVLAVVSVLVLVILGMANLVAMGEPDLALRQLVPVAIGLVALGVLWSWRRQLLIGTGIGCYVVGVGMLVLVTVIGVEANGATRWLDIGAFTFQPSELVKIGILLILAAVLGSALPLWQRFTLAIVLAALPIVVVALQPDLSTATLLVTLTAAMLVFGRVPPRFLLPIFAAAAVIAPLAIRLLRPYQLERVSSFVAGSEAGPDSGWAVLQARIAVARGGMFGDVRDPLHVLYAQYLPERHTDLALASLIAHWGAVAGVAAVLAALILVWRLALASRVARSRYAALVCAGLAVLLGVEVVVSLGGNLGLLPLAGVPFPLLSFGGSATVAHLAALGLILGIRRDGARRRLWTMPRRHNPGPRLARFSALGVTAMLLLFAFFGWQEQAAEGDALRIAGVDQATRCVTIPAPRGTITDRHGAPLSANAPGARVVAIPALLRRDPGDVARLASVAGQPVEPLRAAVTNAQATDVSLPVADVPAEVGERVATAGIPGVVVVPQPRRLYPTGPMLAPILGFVGVGTPAEVKRWPDLSSGEYAGRAGIEAQYDSVLRGVDGQQCVYVDPIGVPVAMGPRHDPIPGANLALSIDLGLQRQMQASLAGLGTGTSVTGAVAMDPRNGEILAMSSLPSYDNNIYGPPVNSAALREAGQAAGSPLVEHVTQVAVPPGSTFKLVVGAAGVAHPVIPPQRVITTGGSFTLGNHTFNNWRSFGPQNLIQAIAWSNDVYFYKLAWMLGPGPMIDTARALGVGEPTGIDLPGESGGYLGTPDSVHEIGADWYPGSTVILGIGQGYLTVTPLQNARWTAGVATGQMVTPHLGLATGTPDGTHVALPVPGATPLPFANVLGPVREGMREAVTGGTAGVLNSVGVPVGAKTGTAQDPAVPGGGDDHWMTAAAPLDNPQIVVTALVQGAEVGGPGTGQVVAATMQHYFAHQAEILTTPPTQQP